MKINREPFLVEKGEAKQNLTTKGKNIKRQIIKIAFFLLCVFAFLISNNAKTNAALVKPTSQFYVNDYANILSSSTEQYIINTNVELNKKTGAQIVVVTVQSLGGMTIEEYAHELFNNFGIGDKTKNNGLLLLCSYGDRQFRVEVGDGLEGKLPDGKTGRMQDEYIIPYLKENNFDEGIKNGYSAFLKEVADEYDVTISGSQIAVQQENAEDNIDAMGYITGMIFMVIWVSIIIFGIKHGGGPFIFFGGGGGLHGGGGFHSGGGFSSGGFHGGGGHSSGGGSSRSF